jgi:hypothetical protein
MSERKIASCRSWVTNSTVRLLRSHTERNSACSSKRVWLSSAPSGELPHLVLQVVPIDALAALAA